MTVNLACGTDEKRELIIDSTQDNLDDVLAFVTDHLHQVGCPHKAEMQIILAADEIFTNIASYAYQPSIGKVRIILEDIGDPAGIRMIFIDQGIPYNPLEKEDPDITLPVEERPVGGLGIFLVKKKMDAMEYRYEDGSNILTMTEYF